MFHLWTNRKTFFEIEDKTKFYCQSLPELQTLSHLEAMLRTSKVLKQALQLARISLENSAHWPEPIPDRIVLLHLLQCRSWRLLSALVLHAVLLEEKTHHSHGKWSHFKIRSSTSNKEPRKHVLLPPSVNSSIMQVAHSPRYPEQLQIWVKSNSGL